MTVSPASLSQPSGSTSDAAPRTTSTNSVALSLSRRAQNSSARSESASARCASSMTTTVRRGSSAAPSRSSSSRPTVRCWVAPRASAVSMPAERSSWSMIAKLTPRSDSSPLARSTRASGCRARKRSASVVLPMPPSPSITRTSGVPPATAPKHSPSAAISVSRPTKACVIRTSQGIAQIRRTVTPVACRRTSSTSVSTTRDAADRCDRVPPVRGSAWTRRAAAWPRRPGRASPA